MTVQRFFGEVLTLFKNIIIKIWQNRTIETYRIFYQKYHLDTCLLNIMLQIHLILYQLNNRKDQVGITQPTEHIIEDAQILILHTLGNTMREWSQHNTVNIRKLTFDIAGNIESIIISITWHTNHQIYNCRTQDSSCLFCGRNLGKSWRIT